MQNTINKDDFHIKTTHINTLFQFIKNNKEDQFLEYISALKPDEIDVNMRDEYGNYLIFFAIIMNNGKILKKIIEYGSRIDILDPEGFSLLYHPIKFNYIEIINTLLYSDKKTIGISLINLKDFRGAVPLFYAIKYKNRYALQELLSNGADANYKNNENMTSLHLAVLKKDVTMVKMILKYIKNINAKTNHGSTALHDACNFQLTEIVKILLEAGADQNIPESEYDFYPIFYAVVQNNMEITKLLIDYHADLNNQDYLGNTTIHYAIMNNHIRILDYMINNYDIHKRNINMYAENINNKINSEKNQNYIDPNIINIEGLTIVHLILYDYKVEYDQYLKKILPHVNLNYQDNSGNTILHIMVEINIWSKFIQELESKKLNIYIKNNAGKTVLDMISFQDREKFIDVVVKSYFGYLRKRHGDWLLDWQNNCSQPILNEIDEEICIGQIKNDILRGKMSIPAKKNKKNITLVENEIVQFSTFTGSLLDMLVGFKYLVKKYPFVTTLFHSSQTNTMELEKYNQSIGIKENPHQHLIHFEIRWIYQRIFLPPGFDSIMASIIKSKRYKYIIIPVGIILSNGNHSNGLFYDIENQIVERFEPHGSHYPLQFNYNPDLLDELIYKRLSNIVSGIYNKNIVIKYYSPKYYLPKIGFQTFESNEISINKNIGDPNGFCTLWTIWYFDYRLKFIDEKPNKLVNSLIAQINLNNYSFRTIIRNYSKKITDLRDTYLVKIDRNINDYLNNRLSANELEKLLNIILMDNLSIN